MTMSNTGMSAGRPSQRGQNQAPSIRDLIGDGGEAVRINFLISKEKRAAFKVWCTQNDTTITDELVSHINRLIGAADDPT
jgi:hypothetical protein